MLFDLPYRILIHVFSRRSSPTCANGPQTLSFAPRGRLRLYACPLPSAPFPRRPSAPPRPLRLRRRRTGQSAPRGFRERSRKELPDGRPRSRISSSPPSLPGLIPVPFGSAPLVGNHQLASVERLPRERSPHPTAQVSGIPLAPLPPTETAGLRFKEATAKQPQRMCIPDLL